MLYLKFIFVADTCNKQSIKQFFSKVSSVIFIAKLI
jgi:hypothetical protein